MSSIGTLSGGDTLFIAEGASRLVKVHPAVLFAVLDHFARRDDGKKRVIGTLLGRVDEVTGVVEVTDCFAVPHSDKNDEVFFDLNFHETMKDLHARVNSKEVVVGWYATSTAGVSIVDSSSLIHDFYTNECADPVHIVVDTSMARDTVAVKAFVSAPLSVHGIDIANMFHQVKVEAVASEPERMVLERMAAGVESEAPAGAAHELANLQASMQRLLDMVEVAAEYVDQVVAGTVKADDETGRRIADTLASVPRIRPEVFDKIFNDGLQDLLMVAYLSSLTKSQLAIAAQLTVSA
jgi:translation initiation factor 3 subunit F